MGRAPIPHLLALLCGFLAAVAVGCGADRSNLIPGDRASSLTQQLADIKAAIDAGQCDGLQARVNRFHHDATSLPNSVDRRLRSRINDGVQSLKDHALKDCQQAAAANTATQTTDTTTTETQTDTTTTQTDTTTIPTTPTDTTTTGTPTTTTPSDGGGDGTGTTTDGAPSDNGGTPGGEALP